MERLRLTQEEKMTLERLIESKKSELWKLGKYKGAAAENEGDAWHDNFAFEQTEIKERALIKDLADLQEKINNAEVISIDEEKEKAKGRVAIGSEVTISLIYDKDEEEIQTVILTGGIVNPLNNMISTASTLGESILNKSAGDQGRYSVNGITIQYRILSVN